MGSDHPAERAKSAKMTAMFHTSLTGTIFIYQGQEIGLCNVPRDWAEEEYKDVETIQALDGERDFRWKQNGKKGSPQDIDVSDVMRDMRWTARDNGRTPMQVSSGPAECSGTADETVGLFRTRWILQSYALDASPQ
jgi:glycosidase